MPARRLPRPRELAPLLRPAPVDLHPTRRRLAAAHTVEDLRRLAARRVPRAIFDYVDGGSEYEVTLRRSRRLFRAVELVPSVLQGVTEVDTSRSVLGRRAALPWVYTPTGVTRVMHHEGERAVARSAARLGMPYGLSLISTTSIEDVAAAAPDGRNWLGVGVLADRDRARRVLDRARAAGYEALVVYVDAPTPGARLKDRYNGLTIPPRPTLKTIADGALHPAWWFDLFTTEPIAFPNVDVPAGGSVHQISSQLGNPAATLDDFAWLAAQWDGPVIGKGVVTPRDARRLVDAGASGIVLSTHGGRQLDQGPLPLRVLPEVVAEVGDQAEVFIDTGVLHGADVVTAVALGATGVFLGRAYLYGLMAGGERGVDRVGQILTEQVVRVLRLLGVRSLDELTPEHVRLP
ncbi:MAG TPA: alpha-hydroxy acid oxidase [Cellulomonas sp.]